MAAPGEAVPTKQRIEYTENYFSIHDAILHLGEEAEKYAAQQGDGFRFDTVLTIPRFSSVFTANMLASVLGLGLPRVLPEQDDEDRMREVADENAGANALFVKDAWRTGIAMTETKLLLLERGVRTVTTAVIHYEANIPYRRPDLHAADFGNWVTYPWEPLEIKGKTSGKRIGDHELIIAEAQKAAELAAKLAEKAAKDAEISGKPQEGTEQTEIAAPEAPRISEGLHFFRIWSMELPI
ncbi:MAG: hypothetical protein JWO47_20 [Candidatus Saccharibacteria bacterium]|nr:hypothetical protein [Candidatus Saccharibacteria bacterium]